MYSKKYVDVVLRENKNGDIIPIRIHWTDGRSYEIDKVISTELRSSEAGGGGVRYVCLIHGQRRNLFHEKDRWFIESHLP